MPTVAETREKVQLDPMASVQLEQDGRLLLRNESSRIFVNVEDFADRDTWIELVSPILREVIDAVPSHPRGRELPRTASSTSSRSAHAVSVS